MPEFDSAPHGILDSLRGVVGTGLAMVQNRVELLGVEIQEHKARAVRLLMLGGALAVAGNMAAIVVTAAVVVLAGEGVRGPVLIGLAVFYLLAALVLFLALRRELRAPPPFKATVDELKKDIEWLKSAK
jgi:uncharacterized membrane protein YqjE